MRRFLGSTILACVAVVSLACSVWGQDAATFDHKRDVIYGRKFGTALTMDVFAPKEKANGLGVIFVVSGGWKSSTDNINPAFCSPFLKHGYTVFAVVHGSQPKYTIPEILEDIHRSVRFIRHNAKEYKIDPDNLGIVGGSAGGHLALMIGTSGKIGDPKAKDPVDRESSKVQAVTCFFPPTDFLNWGQPGNELIDRQLQPPFTAAVDFHVFDDMKALYIPVTDETKLREICREISPITHVSDKSAPTLILHGDKDKLVPLQQSESILAKFKENKVPAELIVRKGEGHGWLTILADMDVCADWFDKYLAKKKNSK
jgi:acetyl esterase/lipase